MHRCYCAENSRKQSSGVQSQRTSVRGSSETDFEILLPVLCHNHISANDIRACLDQLLIAIRSPTIRHDHDRSKKQLIVITSAQCALLTIVRPPCRNLVISMCQCHGMVIRHHVCTVGRSDELLPPPPAVFPGEVLGGLRLLFTTVIQRLYGRVCDRVKNSTSPSA